jgi:lipopolysaccharide biosynthesis glycosyltransferase
VSLPLFNSNAVNNPKIDLVVCLDDRFVIGFVAMLESLLHHRTGVCTLHVFLVQRNVSAENLEKINRYLKAKPITFEWISTDVTSISGLVTLGHFRLENYFRLLVPKLLPQSVKKVLYLDCDIIATDNIGELWELNIDNKKIGICRDWNSGVLLMNLEEWRKEDFGGRLLTFVRENPEKCPLADNSAIIEVAKPDEVVIFDNRWNTSHSHPFFFQGIVHFVGSVKPWHYGYCSNWSSELFYQYIDNTAWRGWRPAKPSQFRMLRRRLLASNIVFNLRHTIARHRWGVKVIHLLKSVLPS